MNGLLNADLRSEIVRIVHAAGEGHIPSCFSIIDIVEVVYRKHIDIELASTEDPNRDIFILSKGHGALALYVVLKKFGLVSESELATYGKFNGTFAGHPDRKKHNAIEASTGSLGHGMPMAVGAALGKKIAGHSGRVICLVGDGETHEGTIWEAAHFGANHQLDNLIVIVDRNESSLQLLPLDHLGKKFEAFGWSTVHVDGHDPDELSAEIARPQTDKRPRIIIARTVKGRGAPTLEGHGAWHHKIPTTEELQQILSELEV